MQGMDLSGPLECSHASYDYVAKMLEQGTPMYLEPHRFTTRSAEVARERPGKELVLDQTHLTVKEVENKDKCPMQGELQVFQALTRRSLACDLMGVCRSCEQIEQDGSDLQSALTPCAVPQTVHCPSTGPLRSCAQTQMWCFT